MVIANSDSNTTLVSLNCDNDKTNNIVAVGETGLLRYVSSPSSPVVAATTTATTTRCYSCDTGGVPTELLIEGNAQQIQHIPLYLPATTTQELELDVDEYISRNYYNNNNSNNQNQYQYQYHDHYDQVQQLPGADVLKESRDRLLLSTTNTRTLTNTNTSTGTSSRLLYVAQGERANATSKQYDVVMSDKATTCHILAFRSSSSKNTNNTNSEQDLPLTSLTHLDGPQYEQCVRDMIQEHIDHHHQHRRRHNNKRKHFEEEKKTDDDERDDSLCDCNVVAPRSNNNSSDMNDKVTIDIHVMGGFNDDDSSSSTITDWLLQLLAQLAKEYKDQVKMVIKTLVVSSSNNEVGVGRNDSSSIINSPIGRGLGINVRTGEVFLAQCDDDDSDNSSSISGPVEVLRSVRLWSRGGDDSSNNNDNHATSHLQPHRLSVVHTVKDVDDLWSSLNIDKDDNVRNQYSLFWVQPFQFRSIPDVDILLELPNEHLLQYTSTSPEVEEQPSFCNSVRASMQFLKHQCEIERDDGKKVFGKNFDQPLVFAIKTSTTISTTSTPVAGDNKSEQPQPQREEWKRLSL